MPEVPSSKATRHFARGYRGGYIPLTIPSLCSNGRYACEEIVTDDGVGFDPNQKHGGFGLTSMQERTNALGGSLTVESVLDQGTRITLSVPVRESQDDEEPLHE